MPTWARRKTGTIQHGFWRSNEDVYSDDCDEATKGLILAAFNTLIGNAGLNCVPAVRDCWNDKWPTIPVDCCVDGSPVDHGGLQALIIVCTTDPTAIQIEIAKGLVQACGGHRLDVKAVLQLCFGAPAGTPTSADFNDFLGEPVFGGNLAEREGTFVIWNRTIGSVWQKTTTTTSGGFWAGSTTTNSKGNVCISANLSWQF
jgi:hypothetical protein